MPRKSEVRDLCKHLQEQGFAVEKARNGHWRVQNLSTGRKVQIAATPSQSRGVLNAITRLKRIGYDPMYGK